MFEGLSVAMVTPFRGGAIDRDATARLVEWMIDGGVQGLVVSGSTGEAATCSAEERRTLLAFVKERVKGRVWIVAGTGTNNTAESITLTRMAEEVGVDGAGLRQVTVPPADEGQRRATYATCSPQELEKNPALQVEEDRSTVSLDSLPARESADAEGDWFDHSSDSGYSRADAEAASDARRQFAAAIDGSVTPGALTYGLS